MHNRSLKIKYIDFVCDKVSRTKVYLTSIFNKFKHIFLQLKLKAKLDLQVNL